MKAIIEKFYSEEKDAKKSYTNWPEKVMYADHLALLKIIDKFKIKTIFEIGTWEGFTSALLCRIPSVKKIVALDICDELNVEYNHGMHPLSNRKRYGKYARKSKKYSIIFEDSKTYEPKDEFEMVFIDGDHSYDGVKNDTELALKMNPKVIVWHDYGSEPGVNDYINELKGAGWQINGFPDSLVVCNERS